MIVTVLAAVTLAAGDTLPLASLYAAAAARDPRAVQRELAATAAAERSEAIRASSWLPRLSLRGEAWHQSDVTNPPIPTASPQPHDRWQAVLQVEQLLFDGGAASDRAAVEDSRASLTAAGVDVSLRTLRQEVDRHYFTAWLLQVQQQELALVDADLRGRLDAMRARVAEGVALPRDTAAIEAERLTVLRAANDAATTRRASLEILQRLTGTAIADGTEFALPDIESLIDGITPDAAGERFRDRPEFRQLAQRRALLDAQARLTDLGSRPRVVGFGQAGVGKPGLDLFDVGTAGFWIAGLRAEWRPWDWGASRRERNALISESTAIGAEEEALMEQLARAVIADRGTIARLDEAAVLDGRIAALRESVAATAALQFDEGMITATEYLTTRTALLDARLIHQRRRAERAQAAAALLTTLGVTLP